MLGLGLGSYADALSDAKGIDYGEIGFPRSGVVGHAGRLVYGRAGKTASSPGVEVLLMQGRVHTWRRTQPANGGAAGASAHHGGL